MDWPPCWATASRTARAARMEGGWRHRGAIGKGLLADGSGGHSWGGPAPLPALAQDDGLLRIDEASLLESGCLGIVRKPTEVHNLGNILREVLETRAGASAGHNPNRRRLLPLRPPAPHPSAPSLARLPAAVRRLDAGCKG